MANKAVNLYHGFAGDQRLSMDIYAASIVQAFSKSRWTVSTVQAQSWLERFSNNRTVMRYLRYFQFPNSVRAKHADIHHVVDHGYAHLAPSLSAGKKIVTVHDLIPLLTYSGVIKTQARQSAPRLNMRSLSYLSDYDQIIAVSESTRNDLISHLDIDAKLIEVIPPIIGEQFQPLNADKIAGFAKQHKLPDNSYWLLVSGNEFYKNHAISLRVLKRLNEASKTPVRLLKTGPSSRLFTQEVQALNLQSLVHYVYLHSIDDMPLAYNFVDCLLFPSLYEGFGMPVIEALACGTPVVASGAGALRELFPEQGNLLDPSDVEGFTTAVKNQLSSPSVALEEARIERFRPDAVSQRIGELYSSLA